ncbi:hypothetical protein [Sphingomonas sp. PP-CE-3G-477]|uniref:hypothetical protein n=1 Tax=Sphingomonas sp. PP-CE-3G-477 TaxID=2135660 RepID=UPI0011B28B47|nr:hypothetical protein [Sphingomonas sp. PP-CE-3G-477]
MDIGRMEPGAGYRYGGARGGVSRSSSFGGPVENPVEDAKADGASVMETDDFQPDIRDAVPVRSRALAVAVGAAVLD